MEIDVRGEVMVADFLCLWYGSSGYIESFDREMDREDVCYG